MFRAILRGTRIFPATAAALVFSASGCGDERDDYAPTGPSPVVAPAAVVDAGRADRVGRVGASGPVALDGGAVRSGSEVPETPDPATVTPQGKAEPGGRAVFRWSAVDGVTDFRVLVESRPPFRQLSARVTVPSYVYQHPETVEEGDRVRVRVTPVPGSEDPPKPWSNWSDWVELEVPEPVDPQPPTPRPGSPGKPSLAELKPGWVTFAWKPPSGTVGEYTVYGERTGGVELHDFSRLPSYGTDLYCDETLKVRVRARNDGGFGSWSAWSDVVKQTHCPSDPPAPVTVVDPPPGAPGTPAAEALYLGAVFTWTPARTTGGRAITEQRIEFDHSRFGRVERLVGAGVTEQRYYGERRSPADTVRARVRAKSRDSAFGQWSAWSAPVAISE